MIDKIHSYVDKYHMITQGDTIIVGVSGGADSVCLLLVLMELRKRIPFTIRVVHIEHGVRGDTSKQDALFVKSLCNENGISEVEYSYDVPHIAREQGISVEEAGRKLRYQAFDQEAGKVERAKIAIAHNQNDNAETMLHHLVRGSALQGIAGIAPVRGNIIRPLLCVTREEIEAYLAERGQNYCTDATNFELVYTRNRIRHEVLPVLKQINAQAVPHMSGAAEVLRETQEYMQLQTEQLKLAAVTIDGDRVTLYKDRICQEPEIIRKLLIHQLIGEQAGSRKDIASVHINDVLHLFDLQVGKSINLPYGLRAERIYEGVRLTKRDKSESGKEPVRLEDSQCFSCRIFDNNMDIGKIPKKKYTKWLDYDKIEDNLCVRNRYTGDFFLLDETGKRKKLKQYFVDEKIPQEQRDEILLIADGSHIVWVVGYRISAKYKVTENTRRILEIQYDGGKKENE